MKKFQFIPSSYGTRTFTRKEIADGTAKSIAEFKRQYPEFYSCEANAEMLMDFILSQLGSNEGRIWHFLP